MFSTGVVHRIGVATKCWEFPGCPWDPGILSILGSVCLHSAGKSRGVPGILGYLVLTDLYASTVLGIPGRPWDPRILSIEGSVCLHSAGHSCDVPEILGYLRVLRDLHVCASTVLGIPGHPWDPGILSIEGSVCLHSAGNPRKSLGSQDT